MANEEWPEILDAVVRKRVPRTALGRTLSVDGTDRSLASMKSFRPKGRRGRTDIGGGSGFKGERRRNDTHVGPRTGSELLRKAWARSQAVLCRTRSDG